MAKKYGIKDVDAHVRRSMVEQAILNFRARLEDKRIQFCCICKQVLFNKDAKPNKDVQNSRWKRIDLCWRYSLDEIWDLHLPGITGGRFVRGLVCEPCNRVYFDHEEWRGKT